MIITDFEPFGGQHCETNATGGLLKQIGINLSEPMLFGIGEGLGFVFWQMKTMGYPFIGGRVKTDLLTENICKNLGLDLNITETASLKKAWKNIKDPIDNGQAVGLKLDCYHLEYFATKIHFAGHYVAMFGYDEQDAHLADTGQQGKITKTSLESLALARSEKGPMSSKNRAYTIIKGTEDYDLKEVVKTAIKNNANDFLNPPIKNLGYKGILKLSTQIKKWFLSSDKAKAEFITTAMIMERAGTGGSIFRNIYRDFLKEAADLLDSKAIYQQYLAFTAIAKQWKTVIDLFEAAGQSGNVDYINDAIPILENLSKQEHDAMKALAEAVIQ